MTLQQILYFHKVAEKQSFTLAAQDLYVAQSGLSYSIQCLEKEIGVPLFARKSGKKITLTSYGTAFLPHAKQILADLDAGRQTIETLKKDSSGVVTVTYSYNNCSSLIAMVFRAFYETHNYNDIAVRFEINQGKALIERRVAAGEQDLAFSCTPSFQGLDSRAIAKQELFLMLPAGHPLASAPALSLQDVKRESFAGFYQNWNLSNWVLGMFQQEGLEQRVVEFFPDWATQMNYVAMGMGLAVSPRVPVDPRYVVTVPIRHPGRFRDVYLHWPSERPLSDSAEHVRQYCLRFFSEHPTTV